MRVVAAVVQVRGVELDAADGPMAAEIRYDLLGALVEEGARHEVARFHAACADVRENLELFGQSGFMAYAQEEIWWRPPEPARGPRSWLRSSRSLAGLPARTVSRRQPRILKFESSIVISRSS